MAIATINTKGPATRVPRVRDLELRPHSSHRTVSPVIVTPLAARRMARQKMMIRRRRTVFGLLSVLTLIALAWPGSAFGGVNRYGASYDNGSTGQWHSGSVYVVQEGDTLNSIARTVSPAHPELVRAALVAELRSDTVVTGEHIEIP